MIHTNNKERVRAHVDRPVPIQYINRETGEQVSETVHPNVYWKNADKNPDYPLVALEFSPEDVPRESYGDEMRTDTYKEGVPTDETVAYIKKTGTPMYAELHATIAVVSSYRGIPARIIADQIAEEVQYQLLYNSDHLREQPATDDGDPHPFEWPLNVTRTVGDGITNLNGMLDEQSVERRGIIFRVEYRYWREEEVAATDALEYEMGLDLDGDGDTDWWDDIRVIDLSAGEYAGTLPAEITMTAPTPTITTT